MQEAGGGGGIDLTPGEFHVMEGTVEVKTDSLYDFAMSYMKDVQAFEMNSAMPIAFMTMDKDADASSRAIGKDPAFTEAYWVALRNSLSSDQAETLTRDLIYGNKALVNVAMVMSEQYNGTDGWNAARTADAVNDAFNPPASADSLADDRAKEDAERNRLASLPVVDPSDVKFYNMSRKPDGSPYVAGEDYIIAGSGTTMTQGQNKTPDNPETERRESDPYFVVPVEQTDQPEAYVPPAPVDENDTNAVRFNPDGSPAPTLQQEIDAAEDEPGVIDAYVEDGKVVRVYDPNMVV